MKQLPIKISLIALAFSLTQSHSAADKVDFGKQIYPILEQNCLSCHAATYVDAKSGRKRKPKGGIRFDTTELIAEGYLNDDDELVKAVVPGQPDKSPLYTFTTLPADHDDIMPSKGDPLTKTQQDLIKRWISEGASFGGFNAPAYVNPKAKK